MYGEGRGNKSIKSVKSIKLKVDRVEREKNKQSITMEQFNDISKHIEKAQGDKARFLKSKEGLLPHFEFPTGETKEEKHYSTETLLADIMEERLNQVKEMMENPILIENVYEYLQNATTQGSKKEGEDTINASWAFETLSSLTIVKDYLHEKGKKIDDENFAKEALNPTENIPPRPEMRNNH